VFVASRGLDVSAGKLQTGRYTFGLVRCKHCMKNLLADIKLFSYIDVYPVAVPLG
jgi:hypothetical protein